MKKAEEFLALCPHPKASPVSCSGPLRATVATGVAAGRYIKGDVLTVAVWDGAKSPLVVWYFYGEEWTGTLRGNKAADRRDLRVEWVEPARHGGSLRYREVSIMQEEERLLREYFGCTDKISPMELIYKAQNARSQRLRSERNQRQAEETRQYMNRLPPLPDDFEKRILKSCSDAVFLWFKNRKVKTILPGGEPGSMWVQDVRCDSCGGEYTAEAESLSHLGKTKCAACGKPMLAHNTRYGAKRKEQARTFVMAQETPDGLWLRRFLVFFSFHEKKANLEVCDRDIYLIDTKRKAIHWKSEYRWQEKRSEYVMAQSAALEKMFVCSQGMYSGSAMVYMDEGLEKQVEKYLGMSWVKRYYKSADIMDICLLWRKIKTVPMLESLIKTGWCNEFLKLFYGTCRHGTPVFVRNNLRDQWLPGAPQEYPAELLRENANTSDEYRAYHYGRCPICGQESPTREMLALMVRVGRTAPRRLWYVHRPCLEHHAQIWGGADTLDAIIEEMTARQKA